MKLADYLKSQRITVAEFAQSIEVDRSTVTRWISGSGDAVKPHWHQMAKIAAATGGAVMPNDFMSDLPELFDGFDEPAAESEPPPAAGGQSGQVRRAG